MFGETFGAHTNIVIFANARRARRNECYSFMSVHGHGVGKADVAASGAAIVVAPVIIRTRACPVAMKRAVRAHIPHTVRTLPGQHERAHFLLSRTVERRSRGLSHLAPPRTRRARAARSMRAPACAFPLYYLRYLLSSEMVFAQQDCMYALRLRMIKMTATRFVDGCNWETLRDSCTNVRINRIHMRVIFM